MVILENIINEGVDTSYTSVTMVCRECGIVSAVLIAVLVYTFYTPLPDDAVEPWKQLLGRSIFRINDICDNVAEKLGYNGYALTRMLSDDPPVLFKDESIERTDTKFDGVDVRIYKPKDAKDNGPGIIHIHGGGWTIGTIEMYDEFVQRLSNTSGFVTVSIGYRRAPEHPFPIPFEDCLAATIHFMKNAKEYNVDPTRIGIVGDSAGGNLAAAVTLKLSTDKKAKLRPVFQTLIYPALQALDFYLPSYRTYNYTPGPFPFAGPLIVRYWSYYCCGNTDFLREFLANTHTSSAIKKSKYFQYIDRRNLPEKYLTESDKLPIESKGNDTLFALISEVILNPYFAPLMASDEELRKLPPTYILTVEYDALRDDGFLYAKRLKSLDVEVSHTHYEGLIHPFLGLDFLDITKEAVVEMVQYWNSLLFDELELLESYKKKRQ